MYEAENSHNFEKLVFENLNPKQFQEFAETLSTLGERLFTSITKTIDKEKNYRSPKSLPNSEELSEIELEVHSVLLQLVDNPEYSDLIKLKDGSTLKLLLFIIPFLERIVWKTKNSNPALFHELVRMEPLWRLLILCWIYNNRNKLQHSQSKEHSPITLSNALGFSRWNINTFQISETNSRYLCVTAPYFFNGHYHDQYVFYVEQGIYFKFCFLAFFSLLANDGTDHTEAEELVSALLRRSNFDEESRKNNILMLQKSWKLALSANIQDDYKLNKFTNREIMLLGAWATFGIKEITPIIIEQIQNSDNESFCLAIIVKSVSNPSEKIIGFYMEIKDQILQISIGEAPNSNMDYIQLRQLDDTLGNDEVIWFLGTESIKSQLETLNFSISDRFSNFLYTSRLHTMAFQSWRISLLNDWLQRHFSCAHSYISDKQQLLGEIGRYVCRSLRELTRADVGATIYQKDYGDTICQLKIVSDNSADQRIMAALDDRKKNMDFIRIKYRAETGQYLYCYQSVEENRFLLIREMDQNRPHAKEYPEDKRPASIMLMPLHLEQRLLGVIEVKGSQPNHFRWSQRLLLQQVASVLAPYFYRQQLLHSLSSINRWVLKHQLLSITQEDGFDPKSLFSGVSQELNRIFLCRVANIWLQSEDRSDRYILMGCSSEEVFREASRSPLDNKIEFFYSDEADDKPDAAKHFLQSFAGHNDSRGLVLKNGELQIEDPDLFKVGRFFADIHKTTNYKEDQGVIRLYPDWVEKDPTKKREYLFSKRKFKEVMAFPLTRQIRNPITGEDCYEVIGFVSLHHDHFFNFSQHWRHTIRLVNNQIVSGLEQIGFIKQEDQLIRRLVLHETKEEAINFTNQIKTYINSAKYTKHELNNILEKFPYSPQETVSSEVIKEIKERLQELCDVHQNKVLGELNKATDFYKNLQEKINYLPDANVYAFLGLKPGEVQKTERINIEKFVSTMVSSFKIKFKSRYINCPTQDIDSKIFWKANDEALRRILLNLFDNASKYAIQGSTIKINATHHSLSISNLCYFDTSLTGDWPFSPGKRGLSVNNNEEGWGYGLCIVKILCEKILQWHCKFSQVKDHGSNNGDKVKFTITITRSFYE